MELFLVIIGLDITILMHYMLKYVKLNVNVWGSTHSNFNMIL